MAIHVKRTISPEGSYALLSDAEETGTAIVFVHGFFGDSQRTWEQLQFLLDQIEEKPLQEANLFFWEYQMENAFVDLAAIDLLAFIQRIFPSPPAELFTIPLVTFDWRLADDPNVIQLRESRPYNRLILVGHSLSAVVIRRMVANDAIGGSDVKENNPASNFNLLNAELALVAPAHIGFQPSGPKAILNMAPFSSARMLATAFRAFADLKPGSYALTQLKRETEQMAQRFANAPALMPRILWGSKEDVVA